MLVDRHVVKMILESAQLLSTAHRVIDGEEYVGQSASGRKARRWRLLDDRDAELYAATHINHPSAVWCRQSVPNYNWLVDHMHGILMEYSYRYEKKHKVETSGLAYTLSSPPMNLREGEFTEPPCAMSDEYIISEDAVSNYRNYYKLGKAHLHSWKRRTPSAWIL
jgi:hypothetical protein